MTRRYPNTSVIGTVLMLVMTLASCGLLGGSTDDVGSAHGAAGGLETTEIHVSVMKTTDLLAETQRHERGDTVILVPAQDLRQLLGEGTAGMPAHLRVADDLDDALDLAEAELLTRTRRHAGPEMPEGPLILVATPAEHADRRMQAILDNGSSLGTAGILIGQWRPGGTAYVRDDGTVGATSPNLTEELAGTRLFTLPATDTTDLLDLLRNLDIAAAGNESSQSTVDTDQLDVATEAPPARDMSRRPEAKIEPADIADRPMELRVLGRQRLLHHRMGAAVDLIESVAPKQRELLACLALHPDGIHRDRLAATIWPDAPRKRPFNRLHAHLSQLRHALRAATGDAISDITVNHGGHYSLDRDTVVVDLWRLQSVLHAGQHGPEEQRLDTLQRAVELYRGDLAEGLTAEWLDAPREALRRDVLDALRTLTNAVADEDPHRELALLERARQLDPYNESTYRDIIRTQARLGLQDAISRTVALLATELSELGQKPSRETAELAEVLRESEPGDS